MKEGLVSVVVPVYKVEKYLSKCVDSILSQTYKNIEIILVDDGSPDRCGEICDEFKEKYNNIKVIHKINEGLGIARNSGMKEADGEYITFVDSDDYIGENLITDLVSQMSRDVDFCKCGHTKVREDGITISTTQLKQEQFDHNSVQEELLPRIIGSAPNMSDSLPMCVWGVMYRLSLICEERLLFPSERELISEDLIFNLNYLHHANSAVIIDSIDYYYCIKGGSLSTSYRPDRFDAICVFYKHVFQLINKWGYENAAVLRLQRLYIGYVRMCIQQLRRELSGFSETEIKDNIKAICNNNIVENVFKSYPDANLPVPQRSFVLMVRYKKYNLLNFMCCGIGNNIVEKVLKR